MANIPITRIRYTEEQGRALLSTFVFGGKYGGSRAPRGIDPELVPRFIRENLTPESPLQYYAAALELLRYYERADVLPQFRLALKGRESTGKDVLRSAYILQAIGELGTRDEAAFAAEYFDRFLVPHPALATATYRVLFDTLVALAPAGSSAALVHRLTTEGRKLSAAQHSSESAMMQFDELAAVGRNDRPRANAQIEIKKRLAAQPADARRPELVNIYLGLAPGGAIVGVWAARLVRKEAIERAPEPVYAEFGRAIESVDERKFGPERTHLIRVRAAQAILYLQGTLSEKQNELTGDSVTGQGNFLWDL